MGRVLVTGLLLICVPPAAAYVRTTTTGTLGATPLRRADSENIRFLVNDQTAAGMKNADGRTVITPESDPLAALQAALKTWSEVPSSSASFAPLETTPLGPAPGDGNHVFVFLDTPEIRSVVGSALAVTRLEFFLDGEIVDTDIIFNPTIAELEGATAFSTTRDTVGTIDLQSVATHELGHALGAGHSGVIGAAMFHFTAAGTYFQSRLSDDDVAFLTEAYPAPDAADAFGSIAGTVAISGSPATGVLVTAVDPNAGVTVSTISDLEDGTYRLTHVPPGSYFLSAEPLDGPVFPSNIQTINLSQFNTNIRTRFVGGNLFPSSIRIQAGTETTSDISVESGVSAVSIERIGVAPPESPGDVSVLTRGPVRLEPGEAADLILAGPGIDATVSEEDIRLLAPGLTLRPGSVQEDPFLGAPGGGALLRMTVDVAPLSGHALGSVVVVKAGAAAVYSGPLVIERPVPVFTAAGVVSSASFLGGGIAPGEIISIFGTGLGPAAPATASEFDPATGGLPTTLAEVRVIFDGVPAPLFFVFERQLNVQVPFEVSGQDATGLVVEFQGSQSNAATVPVVQSHPGIFTAEGGGQAIALNQDNRPNSAANPAQRGGFVTLFATGQGLVDPAIPTGRPAPLDPLSRARNVSVSIGGQPVPQGDIFFAGMTPSFVGLLQVNVRVPAAVTPGNTVPVVISVEGAPSQPDVTLAIQ